MRSSILAGLAILTSIAVANAQDSTAALVKPPKKQSNLIASWEIEQVANQARDAYEVIQLLRRNFLQIRSQGSAGGDPRWGRGPGVLVDDAPRGGTEELRNIQIGSIREIRYLSGPDAASRYGVDYHAGAINVITK